MLMFKLTDGSQTVQGMEYKKISCLSPQTQPGSKVLYQNEYLVSLAIMYCRINTMCAWQSLNEKNKKEEKKKQKKKTKEKTVEQSI